MTTPVVVWVRLPGQWRRVSAVVIEVDPFFATVYTVDHRTHTVDRPQISRPRRNATAQAICRRPAGGTL